LRKVANKQTDRQTNNDDYITINSMNFTYTKETFQHHAHKCTHSSDNGHFPGDAGLAGCP